jgi:hypothetical protein
MQTGTVIFDGNGVLRARGIFGKMSIDTQML